MITLSFWPQAILHLDADAFFASCEQALHPEYRGKPVITGKERNIVACPSYEAKQWGVVRAMPINEALKICPEVIVLPSDYETYSLISQRMFAIMRRFTPQVEEYSIDEGFADLTGLRLIYRTSYEVIARMMKEVIEKELGITVSIGLSLSKSLAKLASKREKPAGFTAVPGRRIHHLLADTPIREIWGFGENTTALLGKLGITTALNFVQKPQGLAKRILGKIGDEIWRELRGEYVYQVVSEEKVTCQSISKVKTFSPASNDKRFVYGQLIRNLESACIKARRYQLAASRVYLYLRFDNFEGKSVELRLSRPSSHPIELAPLISRSFTSIFNYQKRYRATGIVLTRLVSMESIQPTLFDDPLKLTSMEKISKAIDTINARFGKHTVHLAASWPVDTYKRHQGKRGDLPARQQNLLLGETKRQRVNLPTLFMRV